MPVILTRSEESVRLFRCRYQHLLYKRKTISPSLQTRGSGYTESIYHLKEENAKIVEYYFE